VAAETTRVAPNPDYEASGNHQFWFGEGYRDLWATPVDFEVLDLEKEAGGLTVVRQVGGMQTPGLALKDAEGRSYTFRWIDKDPSRLLPLFLRETVVANYFRDQTASSHPGVWPVLNSIVEQFGWVPFIPQRLVVMPDVPELGEYRELFGGAVGSFGEYPMPAHDGVPGFMGSTEIVSSKELWDRWREGPRNRIDSRMLLRERIADLWTGNWDRHRSQWRWAWVPDRELWLPIPEDPDQAFADYRGLALAMARWQAPTLQPFEDRIGGMEGMTMNGADVDRWLLTDLSRDDYMTAAREIQASLTDEMIDTAVRALPPEWYALNGEELSRKLKSRRNGLVDAVELFYLFEAREVNVHATHQDDVARVRRFDDGAVEITVAPAEIPEEPYYERRFDPAETREVRLYLHGGDDLYESEGPPNARMTVRVLGGPGNDTLDDSRSGKTLFYDWEGTNAVRKGRGTHVDDRSWTNPRPSEKAPWFEPRDYGHRWAPEFMLWWEPDLGLFPGAGLKRTSYSFRKYPYSSFHRFFAAFSTKRTALRFDYRGSFRRMNSRLYTEARARASGVDRLNFFGLGNETEDTSDKEFHKVDERLYRFTPTVNWSTGRTFEILGGVGVQYTDDKPGDTLITELQPYGFGGFAQLNILAGLKWDTRGLNKGFEALMEGEALGDLEEAGSSGRRYTGLRLEAGGGYFPKVWDVEEAFGAAEGSLSGYVGLGKTERVVLAARVGGKQTFGRYPWYAAAFIGGSESNRGFITNRFAGDASFYGNFELRIRVTETMPYMPARLWLFGLADVGRVWLEGEDSNDWHPSFGGGVAFELAGTPLTFWTGVAKGRGADGVRFYFLGGFGL
jgi:hypothetical protein